jgi:hypothetical protein
MGQGRERLGLEARGLEYQAKFVLHSLLVGIII